MIRVGTSVCLGAIFLQAPLTGTQVSVVVGGVHAQYGDSISGNAGVAGLRGRLNSGTGSASFDANWSRFTGGGWALQFSGTGAVYARSEHTMFGIEGVLKLNDFQGGDVVGLAGAGPALHVTAGPSLLSLRGAFGSFRDITGTDSRLLSADAALRFQADDNVFLTVRSNVEDAEFARYWDAGGGFQYLTKSVTLGVSAGRRMGDIQGGWGQVALSLPAGRASVEASIGLYPDDVIGFSNGSFAWVGVSIPFIRPSSPDDEKPVLIERLAEGMVRLSVRVGDVGTLDIAGDWNGWTPESMRRVGTRWVIDIPADGSVRRYSLIADGERWFVPNGVLTVPDDFGGSVAVLVTRTTG